MGHYVLPCRATSLFPRATRHHVNQAFKMIMASPAMIAACETAPTGQTEAGAIGRSCIRRDGTDGVGSVRERNTNHKRNTISQTLPPYLSQYTHTCTRPQVALTTTDCERP